MAARPPPLLLPGGALASRLVGEMLAGDRPRLPAGTRFGPFRLVRELGRGGLGVVYLAERADGAFEQQVALKVIRAADERALAETLLARERRLLARLRHPGIAHIVDGGQAGGAVWFAMEYIEGERIDRYCRAHLLDAHARLTLVRKVGEAVAYAHARLIAHRDIKPANILVDSNGEPRLLDFGIAAALDEAEDDDPARRAATPGFASPEQSRGESAGVAADVYQLGRLLDVLMLDVAFDDVQGLDAVRHKALDDRPAHRYANAEAFVADVRALLAQRPVGAGEGDRGYRVRLFLRRHRLGVLAAAVVGAVFVTTAGYFLWRLEAARVLAEREAATAHRVSAFMVSVFEGADPGVHLGQRPTVDMLLARGRQRIERELAGEPRVKGALLAALGRVYLAIDDRESALPLLQEAVALGEADSDVPAVELAERKRYFARTLPVEQRLPDSRDQLGDALALLSGRPEGSVLQSTVMRELDIADCFEGDIGSGIERLTAAIAQARGTPAEAGEAFVSDLFYLGLYLREIGRVDESVPLFEEAHRRQRERHGDDHPVTLDYAGIYAATLARAGRVEDGERIGQDVLARTRDVFGERSPRMTIALARLAEVEFWRGDLDAAIGRYRDAIDLGDALPVGSDIDSVGILESLGDACMVAGRWQEAETAYAAMIERNGDGGRALGPDIGQRPLKRARALAALGRCEEAEALRRQAQQRAAGVSRLHQIHDEVAVPLAGCPGSLPLPTQTASTP